MDNYFKRRAIHKLMNADMAEDAVLISFLMGLHYLPYNPDKESIESAIRRFIRSTKYPNTNDCVITCSEWGRGIEMHARYMGDISEDVDDDDYSVDSYRAEIEDWLVGTYNQMTEKEGEGLPIFTGFSEPSNLKEDV